MTKDLKLEYYLNRYAELSEFAADRVAKVMQLAHPLSVDGFLDIGCSEGTLTTLLGEMVSAKEICGVEVSPVAISRASDKGIKATRLSIETDTLPFEDEHFDLIFCGDVIEHLFDSENLFRESYRVLKKGRYLILTTPNLGSWYNRLSLLCGRQPFGTAASLHYPRAGKFSFTAPKDTWGIADWGGEHIRVMTLKALEDSLRAHNFQIEQLKGARGTLRQGALIYRVIASIDKLMSSIPTLATWLIIRARKPL